MLRKAKTEVPRSARFVLPGVAHHVVARGVDGHKLFFSNRDKERYLKLFALIASEEGVLIHGYCLMSNHVHWLVTPTKAESLARLFHRLHTRWAMYVNRSRERKGHLFQGRYHSTPVNEQHFWVALRYIEVNPRRAGITPNIKDFRYSSAYAHLTGNPDPFLTLMLETWRHRFTPKTWAIFLEETDLEATNMLRRAARSCQPVGPEGWIAALESTYSRRLHPHPPGRSPRRQAAA